MTSTQPEIHFSSITDTSPQNIAILTAIMSRIYIAIGTLGITANVAVVYVILRSKRMRRHIPNWFLINQSVADFWSAIFIIGSVFKNANLELSGSTGDFICRVWLGGMPLWIGFVASLYNLVTLSLERYFEIVHPIRHKILFTKCMASLALVLIWVWSFVWNIIIFIPSAGLVGETCYVQYFYTSPSAKTFLGVLNFSLKMIIPITVFMFCYISMAKSLRSKVGPSAITYSKTFTRFRRNIFKTLIYAITIHVLSWTVNQLLYLSYLLGYALNFTSVLYNVAVALVYVSTCSNPIIYLLKYERFRAAAKEAFLLKYRTVSKRTGPAGAYNDKQILA